MGGACEVPTPREPWQVEQRSSYSSWPAARSVGAGEADVAGEGEVVTAEDAGTGVWETAGRGPPAAVGASRIPSGTLTTRTAAAIASIVRRPRITSIRTSPANTCRPWNPVIV